jgi:putative ABC transport system permease protein
LASNVVKLSSRHDTSEDFGDRIRYVPASGSPEEFRAHHVRCDSEFLNVFRIPIIAGRNFSATLNETRSVIINETFARKLGLDRPIGKRIQVSSWVNDLEQWEDFFVVGMVKDFHHKPLTQTIKPFFLTHSSGSNTFVLYARIQGENTVDTMAFLKKTVQEFNPDDLPPIEFLVERIREIYKTEENQSVLLSTFSALAVLIACLGLFGLAAFTAEQKTKEIGIRKVLGAQTGQLFLMLSMDFGRLAVVANVIGWPLGYYFVNRWMANFAYHVPILPWTFLLVGVLILTVVILTSGTQIIRVSLRNPADILRHE